MELDVVMPQKVNVKSVTVHCKVCDSGSYSLKSADGKEIASLDDYVPGFFPGEHYGDYLDLDIDLETGQILNWKKPAPEAVAEAFNLSSKES